MQQRSRERDITQRSQRRQRGLIAEVAKGAKETLEWLHFLNFLPRKLTPEHSIGRQKLIKPLYEELVRTPEGRRRAREIFEKARPGYHPVAAAAVEKIVK